MSNAVPSNQDKNRTHETREESLKSALKLNGRNLELEVGNALKNQGLSLTHGLYYKDSLTHKEREIDILASATSVNLDKRVRIRVSALIECKYHDKSDFVFFGEDAESIIQDPNHLAFSIFAENSTSRSLKKGLAACREISGHAWINLSRYVAHAVSSNIYSARKKDKDSDGEDVAYNCYRSVISAATALNKRNDIEQEQIGNAQSWRLLDFLLPIVIADTKFCKHYYRNNSLMSEVNASGICSVFYNSDDYFRIQFIRREDFFANVAPLAGFIRTTLDTLSSRFDELWKNRTMPLIQKY